ncbi:MAG: aminoacyl-histidine dipeptidase [Candidatus Aminicenantes bacterium]|nr:aminoacyl-histidine dipeptidase [Candidatus Aminicenantes bacterium]
MSNPLSNLNPQPLWKHFEEICRIPHGSGHEKVLADYVISRAKALNLWAKKDAVGNVLIRKPASPGKEASTGVILQGHLDMVWEKNSDVAHNFEKDPIKPVIRDGWVCADGTTLGADNGIGVAACLAILDDPALVHGPLECLFTVEEETGLTGAMGIAPGFLNGKVLLNLDSEEEGAFTIGCAGGADTHVTLPLARKPVKTKTAFRLMISGLRGGHSGINIHEGRGNALKLLARILGQAQAKFAFSLYRLEGGNKHNAIPREAWADFSIEPAKIKAFSTFVEEAGAKIKAEYKAVEPGLKLSLDPFEPGKKDIPLTPKSRKALLDFLVCCPHGVVSMHPEIPGLVETSTNLAVLRTGAKEAKILCSSRSSAGSALEALRNALKALAEAFGARVKQPVGYPGWMPNLQSPLLQKMKEVHLAVTGKEAQVMAIHAGLECGLIGEKFPGMDMISFGPTLQYPHSPDERVNIVSVGNFWTLLVESIKSLA